MKKKTLASSLVLAFFLAFFYILSSTVLFSSCSKKPIAYQKYTLDYFDTVCSVIGYEENEHAFSAVADAVFLSLKEYHELFDVFQEYDGINNLCTVNKNAGKAPVKVDQKLIDFLLFAKEAEALTDGYLNIAMGSVTSLWKTQIEQGRGKPNSIPTPSEEDLISSSAHTSIDAIIIDTTENTVFLNDPLLQIDVGAIAKGYALEKIGENLLAEGRTSYVLNFGGSVKVLGATPEGQPFVFSLPDPFSDNENAVLKTLQLTENTLVTSGNYQRYYIASDGKCYHHIINPKTAYPENTFAMVSVLCADASIADMFSTALFSMPLDEALALVEKTENLEAFFVLTSDEEVASSGFSNFLA